MSEEHPEKPKNADLLESAQGRLVAAVVLIGLGVVFLLAQTDIIDLSGNWWALFIALPAVALLYNAYNAYQRDGGVSADVRKNVSGGVMVGLTAIIALTGEWGKLWPLYLIGPGVLFLLGFIKPSDWDD